MAVVEEFMIGHTKIRIHDDAYAGKTKEELEEVERRITRAAWNIVRAARAQGIDI